MRTKLALAGAVAAVAAAVAPIAPASAQCDPVLIDNGGSGGCGNACMDTARAYDEIAGRVGLPQGIFLCTQ